MTHIDPRRLSWLKEWIEFQSDIVDTTAPAMDRRLREKIQRDLRWMRLLRRLFRSYP